MKWMGVLVTIALWLATWPQVLRADADLSPCHMMVLILGSGFWTLMEFKRDRVRRRPLPGHCVGCGVDFKWGDWPRCPKCGAWQGAAETK